MKTSAKDAKIGGLILLAIAGAVLGFAITDQILRGGSLDTTNIGGIGIGVMGISFAIYILRMAKKKKNEASQS
ncbi:MAG: hypothetical protein ABR927_15535 [Bacteroidales bacterium]|jgi:mannose/fructose/N-acetylgalactosamine-specific phosphotransferase system component IIC